jgi:histidine triad (HIT) family protein
MSDCLFCKIVKGEIPAKIVHQDDDVIAFDDINPQAPVHVLVIPRKHIATLNDLGPEDDAIMGRMQRAAAVVAKQRGIAETGWRAVVNVGRDAHQLVFHVHLHVLGGRGMRWPPG